MVWPITAAKYYVCETGKSMNAEELAEFQKISWRKISITLRTRAKDLRFPKLKSHGHGEQTAQTCANACLLQLMERGLLAVMIDHTHAARA
jgi:hypothetical protein